MWPTVITLKDCGSLTSFSAIDEGFNQTNKKTSSFPFQDKSNFIYYKSFKANPTLTNQA